MPPFPFLSSALNCSGYWLRLASLARLRPCSIFGADADRNYTLAPLFALFFTIRRRHRLNRRRETRETHDDHFPQETHNFHLFGQIVGFSKLFF